MIDNLLKMIKTAQIYNFCNILLLIFFRLNPQLTKIN